MNLIDTPKPPNRSLPQGRISITIGNIAVDARVYKAHPCHSSGTEVIGNEEMGGNGVTQEMTMIVTCQ
jgi:hypothetical protein